MQNQNKNLFLFAMIALLILVGTNFVQNYFWPPKKSYQREIELLSHLMIPPNTAGPGIEIPARLALEAVRDMSPAQREAMAKEEAEKIKPEPVVTPLPKPFVQGVREDRIQLGDDSSNIKVFLTTQGAGVQELILNKFKEANRLGRPEPGPLVLIPDDPLGTSPSNMIYHYARPEKENPDDTLGKMNWRKVSATKDEVIFSVDVPGQDVTITKTYTLKPGDYHLGLTLEFKYKGTKPKHDFRYQLVGAHGLPIEGKWYTGVYRNALIGRVDKDGYVWRNLEEAQQIGFHAGGKDITRDEMFIQYAGIATQYFASVIVVDNVQTGGVDPKRILAWARPTLESEDDPEKQFLADITMRVIAEPMELTRDKPVIHNYLLYNGPLKVRLLSSLADGNALPQKDVDFYETTLHLNTLADYPYPGTPSFFQTIGWSRLLITVTNLMHFLLELLHKVIPNYGLCIICLTVLVRGIMFPLSRRQALASVKMQAKMQELAPEVKKLEEKFKGDAMGLQQAKNELYLKRGIHPLAMMGTCWIALLQMPIFLGLYYALQESILFRLAGSLWIRNLAAPDMLFFWSESIPFVSRPQDLTRSFPGMLFYLGPYFNLLPIIAVIFMMVQQKMLTPPPTDEQQAAQQKMMKFMTVFFGIFFYKVAAGVCLYYIVSSAWGLAERKLHPKHKAPGAAGPDAGKQGIGQGQSASARSKSKIDRKNGNGAMQKVRDFWQKVLKEAKKK